MEGISQYIRNEERDQKESFFLFDKSLEYGKIFFYGIFPGKFILYFLINVFGEGSTECRVFNEESEFFNDNHRLSRWYKKPIVVSSNHFWCTTNIGSDDSFVTQCGFGD